MHRDEFEERLLAVGGMLRVGACYQKLAYKYEVLYEVVVNYVDLSGRPLWKRAALHSEEESMADVLEQFNDKTR